MDNRKLLTDYLYTLLRMVLYVGFPIIILPYVIKRIGPEGYGAFAYTNSIVGYFFLASVLGIPEYAYRIISRNKDQEDLDRTFSEIYSIQFVSVTITLICFFLIFLPHFDRQFYELYLALSFLILSSYFNVEWYYVGNHRFKFIAIRGIVVKTLNAAAVFAFLKEGDGATKYALITSLTALLNGLINFIPIAGKLRINSSLGLIKHLKPIFLLFGLSIAGIVNSNIDKTITGKLAGSLYVGYYALGHRITHLIQHLFISLNSVVYPRIMTLLSSGKKDQSQKLMLLNLDYILMLSLPMALGIVLYGKHIIILLFSKDLLPAVPSFRIMAVLVPVMAIKGLIKKQILLPNDKDKILFFQVLIETSCNIIFTLLLVSRYRHVGAALATVTVETMGLLIQLFISHRILKQKLFSFHHVKYLFAPFVLFLPYYYVMGMARINLLQLILAVLLSIILYFIVLIIIRDRIILMLGRKLLKKGN